MEFFEENARTRFKAGLVILMLAVAGGTVWWATANGLIGISADIAGTSVIDFTSQSQLKEGTFEQIEFKDGALLLKEE